MIATISAELSKHVESAERTMRILWIALMSSAALYGVVLFTITQNGEGQSSPNPMPPFLPPLLALSSAVAGTLLFRAMSTEERVRALLQQSDSQASGPQVATPKALSEGERRLARVPTMFFTLYIVRWALFESVAIFGLVFGILDFSFEKFVPYGLAAIALIASTPPRIKSRVLEAVPLLPPDVRGY